MEEVFRNIVGFDEYQVSNLGRIKSFKNGNERILKQYIHKSGYCIVGLTANGKEFKKRIHILVAEAFLNHDTDNKFSMIVDHINNVKTDNRTSNLQVVTIRTNSSKDQFRKGTSSNFTGVSFYKQNNKWASQIQIGQISHHLGYFDNEKEAALEYRKALIHLERSFDNLDSYHFEKAPKKHRIFLNGMYQFYLSDNL